MNGSEETVNDSKKHSISQSQLKDCPLTKQDILQVYSDVFTGIGKFPGMPYKFQLEGKCKPTRHAPRKVPIHLQDAFHSEIRNLLSNDLGNGEISLLSLWQTLYT